jgi:hypothetical protein
VNHKLHKNNAARQRAYRDRIRAAKHTAHRAAMTAARNHDQHQQPDPICLICVGNQKTVTQTQTPVTVDVHPSYLGKTIPVVMGTA